MSRFEYTEPPMSITVKLDRKIIGSIKQVTGGYQYFPKGMKTGGEIFQSVAAVKFTIEAP